MSHLVFFLQSEVRMNSQLNSVEIMERLRLHTQELHQLLERHPFNQALLAKRLPLSLYIQWLEALLPLHRAVEQYCAMPTHSVIQVIWQDDMVRSFGLAEDITYLKSNSYHSCSLIPPLTTQFLQPLLKVEQPWRWLGVLYTLEGSTLGARVLLPVIQMAYALQEPGVRYYQAYGEKTASHWKNFKARMNAMITEPSIQTQVLESAYQTFLHIETILTTLWQAQ
jgi:heme oxygenase